MSKFIGTRLTLPNLATAPSSPAAGDAYYDTVANTAYVYNGTSWVDLAAGGGGSGDITDVVAGTGLTGGASTGTATLNIDTSVVATLGGTQTLTNKTLTSPALTTPSIGAATATQLTVSAQGQVRLGDLDSSNYVALKAPATVNSNVTLTFPSTAGSANQVLTTDGSGVLSWAAASGAWASYTPTFGGGLTIGNGTLVSRYLQNGNSVFGKLDITIGSTTNVGNGLTFTLPSTPVNTVGASGSIKRYTRLYPVYLHQTGTATVSATIDSYGLTMYYSDLSYEIATYNDLVNLKTYNFANEIPDTMLITSSRPFALGSGDIMEFSFWYEVA